MTHDPYAAGLAPEDDFALTAPLPEAPGLVETFNLWLHDGPRETCINFGPHLREGHARALATIFLPGGRILRRHTGDTGSYDDPRRFGNPYVRYECVEPFRRWIFRLDAVPMIETSHAEIAAGGMRSDEPTVTVSAEIHLETRTPAWIMGTLIPEMGELLKGPIGRWVGGRLLSGPSPFTRRYEQLAEAHGTITIDGTDHPFHGTGMRAHVRGQRDVTGMASHFWGAALWPDGRGVDFMGFLDADNRIQYGEALLLKDGVIHPARIVAAMAADRLPTSAPYAYEFETEKLGRVRIEGLETSSFVWSSQGWAGIGADETKPIYGLVPEMPLVMKQSPATYLWDGAAGYGMREVSNFDQRLS